VGSSWCADVCVCVGGGGGLVELGFDGARPLGRCETNLRQGTNTIVSRAGSVVEKSILRISTQTMDGQDKLQTSIRLWL
jgi:hypothetical protein